MDTSTVKVLISADMEKVWKFWTSPKHIAQWNTPNEEWHVPRVENDLQQGGKFFFRMEKRDGSLGFDHCGRYDKVVAHSRIEYTLEDGRRCINSFSQEGNKVLITETFEPESETPIELQIQFVHAVLNKFKTYVEGYRKDITLLLQAELHHRLFNNVLEGFTEQESNQRLLGQLNHVKYLAGHLLNANYGMAAMAGLKPEQKWNELFAVMGQSQARDGIAYPSLAAIREEWNSLWPSLRNALERMDWEELQQPPPSPFDQVAATCGAFWAFINHHCAYHIGQIALLRIGFGKAPMQYA